MNKRDRNVASPTIRIMTCAAMIVMAIAILTQSFAAGGIVGAREKKHRSACAYNLKQIDLCLKMYAQDFAWVYPWNIGQAAPQSAWIDLGMLYPDYVSKFHTFFCPSSNDKQFKPKSASGDKASYPFEPLSPASTEEVISYAYSYDARQQTKTAWTDHAPATIRLLADKKAAYDIEDDGPNSPTQANHKAAGRNVAYQDGHVKWKAGAKALDPDEEDDDVGKPDAKNYADWWSDPPWYGEGMEEKEEGATAEGAEHAE